MSEKAGAERNTGITDTDAGAAAGVPGDEPAGRTAEGRVEIRSDIGRVWSALTEAAELERWFPLEAEVEPGPGGRIWMSWGNEHAGWSEIERWDPPHHLRISWTFGADPAQVTDFRLEGRGGTTHLRVVTSGFPEGSRWDDMVEGTRLGWLFELAQLRHYLERHDHEERRAIFIRRRVSLPRQEAWERLTGPGGIGIDVLADRVVDRSPPWQLAAVTTEPSDGLIRLTIDPTHTDPSVRDVSVWVAAWGDAGAELDTAGRNWSDRLASLFPDGQSLVAGSAG